MTTSVAFLRGINVGGHGKVPMQELRDFLEAEGLKSVTTYIQSGNVVFTSTRPVKEDNLASLISSRFSVKTTVAIRSASAMKNIVDANPFAVHGGTMTHVGFLTPTKGAPSGIPKGVPTCAPEEAIFLRSEIYLFLPNGMGRSKLPAHLDRRMPAPLTYRNWNTVVKLAEMAGASTGR